MLLELHYGRHALLPIDVPPAKLVADSTRVPGTPLVDVQAAAEAAVASPLGYPPLSQAVIPGDRIVIAADSAVTQLPSIVAGIVKSLLDGCSEPGDLAILLSAPEEPHEAALLCQQIRESLPSAARERMPIEVHDPTRHKSFAYLAISKEGHPIQFHRWLCDADMVIPISVLRLDNSLGYLGVAGGLFPAFADAETWKRFHAPSAASWTAVGQRRKEESAEAVWLLGVRFAVQVLPGPGDSVLAVLAGEADEIGRRGLLLSGATWQFAAAQRANLVIAAVEGGPPQQTWDNLARALYAAGQVVRDGGAVVVCTDLQTPPGPALRRLARGGDAPLRAIRRDRSFDAISARLLAEIRQRANIFLVSRLDREVVEDLGMGYIERPQEIEHLLGQYASCIVLAHAQHAMMRVAERG